MQERHVDRKRYFKEQGLATKTYVIPYIEDVLTIDQNSRVLEIGCGEGGNLVPFIERGCEVVGVDINSNQIENARAFIDDTIPGNTVNLLSNDIYKVSPEDIGTFDLVMMRDVIEHIPNQDQFINHLQSFLKPKGKVFFGYPPWCMPFGGHQQICESKLLSKLPYFHLLPTSIYKYILKAGGESDHKIDSLIEIKETGISINRFEKIINTNGFQFDKKTFYLINPNYEIKFGLKPIVQFSLLRSIPVLRDFVTTCYYCVVSKK